jgi:hypothetical protein
MQASTTVKAHMPHAHPNFPRNEEDHPTIPLPDPSLADLAPSEALLAYQSGNVALNPPLPIEALTPTSLLAGRITSSPKTALAAYEALVQAGVIDAETKTPVTSRITDQLVPQVRVLSVVQVKELVKLLFFWEEQIQRLQAPKQK